MEKKKNNCKNCEKEMQEGWKICPYCGTSLESQENRLKKAESPRLVPRVPFFLLPLCTKPPYMRHVPHPLNHRFRPDISCVKA
jgi:predicted amidophosphoribosyltransferase